MLDVEQREIDGCTVDLFQMDVKTSMKVLTRLTKMVGEPIGILSGGTDDSGAKASGSILDVKLAPDALQMAAKAFVERLDEELVYDTIEKILNPLHIQMPGAPGTMPVKISRDFHGKLGLMFKVLVAALEVNYKDFLEGNNVLSGLAAKAMRSGKPTLANTVG